MRVMFCTEMLVEFISRPYIVRNVLSFVLSSRVLSLSICFALSVVSGVAFALSARCFAVRAAHLRFYFNRTSYRVSVVVGISASFACLSFCAVWRCALYVVARVCCSTGLNVFVCLT